MECVWKRKRDEQTREKEVRARGAKSGVQLVGGGSAIKVREGRINGGEREKE